MAGEVFRIIGVEFGQKYVSGCMSESDDLQMAAAKVQSFVGRSETDPNIQIWNDYI